MLYRIRNFGVSKDVIVKGKIFLLARSANITTENDDFAFEAAKIREVEVSELYEKMNYFKLRRMAKDRKIKFKNNTKKDELMQLLKNGDI